MKCTVLTVGTEILFGSIVNTNAVFISQELQNIGVDVMYHMTCGDNPKRLKEMLAHAYEDCDLVITTGGLGPTQDDLTKEMISEFFGERLIPYPEEIERIENWFKRSKRPFTENNIKQGYFPKGNCRILPNSMGTAPGFMISKAGRIIICLPGPPVEMKPMFNDYVKPILTDMSSSKLFYKSLRFIDIGESKLETDLLPLIDNQTDPTLATYATPFECSLRIASKRSTLEEAEAAVEEMCGRVKAIVGQYLYSEDGTTMPDLVLKTLMERKITLSCAESITGGMFAKRITDMPGISSVFNRGIVTYTNEAKMQELGVKEETLQKYTEYSHQCAYEMADGLHNVSGSDICISVTGIAGPDGGTEENPAGTYYIGIWYNGECKTYKHFEKRVRRDNVRNSAMEMMFRHIYKTINGIN